MYRIYKKIFYYFLNCGQVFYRCLLLFHPMTHKPSLLEKSLLSVRSFLRIHRTSVCAFEAGLSAFALLSRTQESDKVGSFWD
jgi:hypothetical protein